MAVVQYQCPNCGGPLEFKADNQHFGCEYCLSTFSEAEIQDVFSRNESIDLSQNETIQAQTDEFAGHTNLYICDSCGAEIMSDDNTSATFCCYCHNPVVLSGRLSGDYKPSLVLPFKLTKENALDIFEKWSSKKKFLPSDFKTNGQMEKMTGLYVPFWLADCKVEAEAEGVGKKITTWSDSDYHYTKTREYDIRRRAKIKFTRIPADGSSKISDELIGAIEPFDYNQFKDFSMSYLSGFFADKYDVDKAGVFPIIKNRANAGTNSIIESSVHSYNSVSYHRKDYRILQTDWEYVLMPVWFMNYKHKDKVYSYAINGQSGKIAGKLPLSKAKLFGLCALILGIGAILGLGASFVL